MLNHTHRLKRRSDFSKVYRLGKNRHAKDFSIKYQPNRRSESRVAVVVSTKVSKKAVIRNRIRRRFYAQLRLLWNELEPGFDIIILVRREAADLKGIELSKQLRYCLESARLLKNLNTTQPTPGSSVHR